MMRTRTWFIGCLAALALLALAMPAGASNILFIGDRDGDIPEYRFHGDEALISAARWWGNTVLPRDDGGPKNGATAADLAWADLVVISATASSGAVNTNTLGANTVEILASGKDIINMEPGLADEIGLAPGGGWSIAPDPNVVTTYATGMPLLTNVPNPGAYPSLLWNGLREASAQGSYNFLPAFDNLGIVHATVVWDLYGANVAVLSQTWGDLGQNIVGAPFGEDTFNNRTMKGLQVWANCLTVSGAVPEPATWTMLVSLGLMGLFYLGRKRAR